jgi:hypothetical protein
MASVLKVDKLDPQSGTALEIGTSGDTISVPSGATLDISASTLTPPATMPASSGVNLTALNATQLTSGKVPTAQLGTGTASSTTILYGDQTYKTEPSGFDVTSITGQVALGATPADTDEFVLSDAGTLKKMDYDYIKGVHKNYWFARHANPQSISEAVSTKITMLTTIDPDSLVSSSTWTAPSAGNWFFFYCLSFINTTHMQQASAKVYINGSSADRYQTVLMSSGDTQNQFSLGSSFITLLSASDTVEMYALCEASGNTATTSVKTDSATLFGGWKLP